MSCTCISHHPNASSMGGNCLKVTLFRKYRRKEMIEAKLTAHVDYYDQSHHSDKNEDGRHCDAYHRQ